MIPKLEKSHGITEPSVYVIGENGFKHELHQKGIKVKNFEEAEYRHPSNAINMDAFSQIQNDPNIISVIVGTDYNLTMRKMCEASTYLTSNSDYIEFLGTNVDRTDGKDRLRPSGGSLVKLIEQL